jgi:hypothetical protein
VSNSSNEIDADRLVADPRAMDELNRAVISEFRANQGRVSGPMEGMPILLPTMTGSKTGRTLIRPLCYSRDGDRLVIIASMEMRPVILPGTTISSRIRWPRLRSAPRSLRRESLKPQARSGSACSTRRLA